MAHMQQGPQAAFTAMFGLPAPKVEPSHAAATQPPVAPIASNAAAAAIPTPQQSALSLPGHLAAPTAAPFVSVIYKC